MQAKLSHLFSVDIWGVQIYLGNMRYKDAKTLYDEIKSADNKELYAICTEIINTTRKQEKQIEKNKTKSNVLTTAIDFNDQSLTRTHTLQNLYQMMLDGNATAGKYFAEYTNIKQDNDDLRIEIVRFKDITDYDDLSEQQTPTNNINSCQEIKGQVQN